MDSALLSECVMISGSRLATAKPALRKTPPRVVSPGDSGAGNRHVKHQSMICGDRQSHQSIIDASPLERQRPPKQQRSSPVNVPNKGGHSVQSLSRPGFRQSIRATLSNRASFELAFQFLTNDILSGNPELPIVAVDEILLQLQSPAVSLMSKLLCLEVTRVSLFITLCLILLSFQLLDALVVIDIRCLCAVASNPTALRFIVDLAELPTEVRDASRLCVSSDAPCSVCVF